MPLSCKARTGEFSPFKAVISLGGSQLLRIKQLLWVVSPICLNRML